MKLLVVTTCGTSVLTNEAPEEMRRWLTKIANERELGPADAGKLAERVEDRRKALAGGDGARRRKLSAEFAGIGAILDKLKPKEIQHVFLHTDTAAGEAAAKIVAEALRKTGHEVQLLTAGGLRTNDLASFRAALADITRDIEKYVSWREKGWTIYFNLTGGFKSINGYLQALGMIHADRCTFQFEGSPALMEIPRLPIRLAAAEDIRPHLRTFRKLEAGYTVTSEEAKDVPESLLFIVDDQVLRSVWGDAVWARVQDGLLAEKLLDPLSARIEIREKARRDFKGEEDRVRVAANKALDKLSAQLDGVQKLPNSHEFKRISGDPVPPSTHELYIPGPVARRIYGHYDGANFVVDAIGEHL